MAEISERMRSIIQKELKEIEDTENVRIIHCIESGSRAWGFASPDSDYDVRFIYVRPLEYYLQLGKTRDVIEWKLDETLDINGWDIQKALRLLHNSNPTLFEWNLSPIVYKSTDEWKRVSDIISNYFVSKAGLHHYLSTAKGNYREYLKGDTVRLKKYFYVIRPILACEWIMDRQTPPPVLFDELAKNYMDKDIAPIVNELVELKKKTPELGEGKRIDILNEYIDNKITYIEKQIKELPFGNKSSWEELNELFVSLIRQR
jgi:hypothetical protein